MTHTGQNECASLRSSSPLSPSPRGPLLTETAPPGPLSDGSWWAVKRCTRWERSRHNGNHIKMYTSALWIPLCVIFIHAACSIGKKGGYFIVKVNWTDAPNISFVYLSSSFPKKLKQKKKVLQHHYLVPDGVQAIILVTTRPVFLPRVPLVLRMSLVLPAFCLRAAWAWKPLRLPLDCGPLTSRVRTAQIPPTRPTGFGAWIVKELMAFLILSTFLREFVRKPHHLLFVLHPLVVRAPVLPHGGLEL